MNLAKPEIALFDPQTPKTPSENQTRSKSDDPPRRYRQLNFPRWRPSRHLGFGETGNSAIRSAVPQNPTVEPNMKWIGRPLAEIWPFEIFPNESLERSVGRWSVVGRSSIIRPPVRSNGRSYKMLVMFFLFFSFASFPPPSLDRSP